MRRAICLCLLALLPLISAMPNEDMTKKTDMETEVEVEEEKALIEGAETARILTTFIFPFFPQYTDVDMGEEVNKLKSSNTVAFFVIRDTMQVGSHTRLSDSFRIRDSLDLFTGQISMV